MCSYQDTQILSKRIFSTLGLSEDSQEHKSFSLVKKDQEGVINDILIKKKKMFDTKAPGLFEYLAKLSQDDATTDVTSVGSEHDAEEAKPLIHIPIPRKASTYADTTQNLSKAVKATVQEPTEAVAEKNEGKSSVASMEEEQQQKMLHFLMQNTMMLNTVMVQSETSRRMVLECREAINVFRTFNNDDQKTYLEKIEKIREEKKNSNVYNSNPIGESLFNHLFGTGKIYKYELILDGALPQPIFRERNISIKVKLVNSLTQEATKHDNKLTLNLFLQTWEIPSTAIQRNKAGNKAIMGETEVEMKDGEAIFERIQINEVTSKFIHGYVAMIILPTKPLNHGTSLSDHCQNERYINFEDVKPLMLEKVVVKSKKKNINKNSEK